MRRNKISIGLTAVLVMFAATLLTTGTRAAAQTDKVLYSFGTNNHDGNTPFAGLIFDSAGNLYGTTEWAGTSASGGTVFELSPAAGGGWTEKVLFDFSPNNKGGSNPYGGLIFDATGNLYGTAASRGAGYGTVFKLSPQTDGSWTETVVHEFGVGNDGKEPEAGLIFDAAGSLYGTTFAGGIYGYGVAFKLTPQTGGKWTEKLLHSFGNNKDGQSPAAGLGFDAAGNLYGTTAGGGNWGHGMAFELKPTAEGGWTEAALHQFGNSATDGQGPYAGLILDAAGNLYGTTAGGGTYGGGTAFELTPKTGGGWTETVLHDFNSSTTDGESPFAGLTFDASGNLYGTTYLGGTGTYGTVFKLTPTGATWTETQLADFYGEANGSKPVSGVIFDAAGNLYGTTEFGGGYAGGSVFEITP
jgi:uncharacterized repeat protein (TIGR03803 family)